MFNMCQRCDDEEYGSQKKRQKVEKQKEFEESAGEKMTSMKTKKKALRREKDENVSSAFLL